MQFFLLLSILISLAAVFSYINIRFLHLPAGISLMLMGSLASLAVLLAGHLSLSFTELIQQQVALIDFPKFILGMLLSFLLFAGSLHLRFEDMKSSAKSIISFATISTLLTTFFIGSATFYLLQLFGISVPYFACLLFGAVISPTDPIAVIGILRQSNLPASIETKIVGESLFNDGIGVVVFTTLVEIADGGTGSFSFSGAALLFLQEVLGGLSLGLLIGYMGYKAIKSIDHFQTEILISLAMVMGGYSLCQYLHVSGPLAMVVAGLFTGNISRSEAMSELSSDYLEKFWEVTDETLNAMLFMLIGLELVTVSLRLDYFFIGLCAAILLLVARYISLLIPAHLFRFHNELEYRAIEIMTWGGLRGGISIALALSLPQDAYKDVLVSISFVIVQFSIFVQGLSINRVMQILKKKRKRSLSVL